MFSHFVPDSMIRVGGILQFRFQLAFKESGVIEGEGLIETLQNMTQMVDKIIGDLAPLLT